MKRMVAAFVFGVLLTGTFIQASFAADVEEAKQPAVEEGKAVPAAAPGEQNAGEQKPAVTEPAQEAEQPAAAEKAAEESASSLTAQIKFGTGVVNREIVGESVAFSSDTAKVYCWSAVEGASEPTEVKHVWYHEGDNVSEITLKIPFPKTRTWSNKTIYPGQAGEWKVDVVDAAGKVIATGSFSIK